jgi:hypothetical protein
VAIADLEGSLQDLISRTQQLRAIMVLIDVTSKAPEEMGERARKRVDISLLGGTTSNTTNAMCIVFLAASFEEFFRELVSQCGVQLADSYDAVPEETKLTAKSSYWKACLDSLRFNSRILTRDTPRSIDVDTLGKARSILDSARGFIMLDDSSSINGKMFCHHSRNYRPVVVDEIASRIGVKKVMRKASDSNRLRRHFGVTTVAEVEPKLIAKLNSFYETRNGIVHSLSSATGFGTEYVNDHIDLIEAFADSLKNVLYRHISGWVAEAA